MATWKVKKRAVASAQTTQHKRVNATNTNGKFVLFEKCGIYLWNYFCRLFPSYKPLYIHLHLQGFSHCPPFTRVFPLPRLITRGETARKWRLLELSCILLSLWFQSWSTMHVGSLITGQVWAYGSTHIDNCPGVHQKLLGMFIHCRISWLNLFDMAILGRVLCRQHTFDPH